MAYDSYDRRKIVDDELEPAARDVVTAWRDSREDMEANDRLEAAVRRLDEHDARVDKRKAESTARKRLQAALIDARPLVKVDPVPCATSFCSRNGAWTYRDEPKGPRCKQHAEKAREGRAAAIIAETYGALGVPDPGVYSLAPSVEITRKAAERLGVELPS